MSYSTAFLHASQTVRQNFVAMWNYADVVSARRDTLSAVSARRNALSAYVTAMRNAAVARDVEKA